MQGIISQHCKEPCMHTILNNNICTLKNYTVDPIVSVSMPIACIMLYSLCVATSSLEMILNHNSHNDTQSVISSRIL